MLAILGPTASGKSRLAIEIARRYDGEIVSCDSTAVYRGFDIGTDKVAPEAQAGIPHHLVDVVPPTERYTAARYARDAAAAITAIRQRRRWPIVVGGTGFYYRALTRGLFPGPGRDAAVRARLIRVADRRGLACLHGALGRIDPESAARIQPRDRLRIIRALEVYRLTGRPLSRHFERTTSPLGETPVVAVALRPRREIIRARVTERVDDQFARGVVDEVRGLLAQGVPATAHPFRGLVYRHVLALLAGERSEAATRALIVQENMRYARRQLTWFRGEPGVVWVEGIGERPDARDAVLRLVTDRSSPPGREGQG